MNHCLTQGPTPCPWLHDVIYEFPLSYAYPELSFSGSPHNGHSTAVIGQEISTLGPHCDQFGIEVANTTQVHQGVIT